MRLGNLEEKSVKIQYSFDAIYIQFQKLTKEQLDGDNIWCSQLDNGICAEIDDEGNLLSLTIKYATEALKDGIKVTRVEELPTKYC